jgi:hypothetical protein
MAPDENACAITLSMTLGLQPQGDEKTLANLDPRARSFGHHLWGKLFNRDGQTLQTVTDADIAKRYYINSEQLAARLGRDWGPTTVLSGREARTYLSGKKGIIYIWHGYRNAWRAGLRTGNHIDVWNGDRIVGTHNPSTPPIEEAQKVWFWELPSGS